MNGDISIESRQGEGTKFTVTVFLKQQNTKFEGVESLANLPVLVADDDVVACESTCLMLDELGMRGEWVLDGRKAVERVCEAHQAGEDFFAVILDWKMPGMDGLATARAIRSSIGQDMPVIILSSYDWSSIEAEARQAGVGSFISKPLFKSRLFYLFKKIAGSDKEAGSLPDKMSDLNYEGKRILLVEDNEINCEIAEEIIGYTGATVESAENGKVALEKFLAEEEGYYDLIFMDIQMPVMNGYEAARAIRGAARKDALGIPIVAMTANAFAEDVAESRKAGMNEHISKPLNVEQLMKCMKRFLG